MAETGQRGPAVFRQGAAFQPRPQELTPGPSSQRPWVTGCPICIYLGTGGWGRGMEVPKEETRFQTIQHVFTEGLPGIPPSSVTWR